MPEVIEMGGPGGSPEVAALIFAHVDLAMRIAAVVSSKRGHLSRPEAGRMLLEHASAMNLFGRQYGMEAAALKIASGLEAGAERNFGVKRP